MSSTLKRAPPPSIYEYRAKLSELLPADDPRTPWLLRLVIIGDDLRFELQSAFSLNPESSPEDTWRAAYYIRKITVTLLEAGNIFRAEVPRWIKELKNPDPRFVEATKIVRETLDTSWAELERIRHGIGGHIRPRQGTRDFTQEAERYGAKMLESGEYTFRIDTESFRQSSYRQLTAHSFMFVWLESILMDQTPSKVVEGDKEPRDMAKLIAGLDPQVLYARYNAKHRDLSVMLMKCAGAVLQTIDWMMMAFWRELGREPVIIPSTQ